jgi:hypothetical protein
MRTDLLFSSNTPTRGDYLGYKSIKIESILSIKIDKYLFIYLALPTRAGSPQQHMPITVGPFCLTHPVIDNNRQKRLTFCDYRLVID